VEKEVFELIGAPGVEASGEGNGIPLYEEPLDAGFALGIDVEKNRVRWNPSTSARSSASNPSRRSLPWPIWFSI
jgi:hypothetical protein